MAFDDVLLQGREVKVLVGVPERKDRVLRGVSHVPGLVPVVQEVIVEKCGPHQLPLAYAQPQRPRHGEARFTANSPAPPPYLK